MVRLIGLLFILFVLYLIVQKQLNQEKQSEEILGIQEPSIITVEELPDLQ
jgi:hypothetical protein